MVVTLPYSTGSAALSWQWVDFLRLTLRTDLAAGGGMTGSRIAVEGPPLEPDELWLIDHAVITCDSTLETTLKLYETLEAPERLLSGSALGNFDEAEYAAGLQIAPGSSLLAVWTGASVNARGFLSLQGRVFRQVAG